MKKKITIKKEPVVYNLKHLIWEQKNRKEKEK